MGKFYLTGITQAEMNNESITSNQTHKNVLKSLLAEFIKIMTKNEYNN